MTSSLPLLSIPYVPLNKIIDFMDPSSLVSMSLCSQKSRSVIKTHRKIPIDGRLHISFNDERFHISFNTFLEQFPVLGVINLSKMPSSVREEFIKLNGKQVPVRLNSQRGFLLTYWEDEVEGLKSLTDYITSLFSVDVLEITFTKKSIWMIDWVNSRQQTPIATAICEHGKDILTEEEMLHILKECPASLETVVYPSPPPNFKFRENFKKIDCLILSHGLWVTIENLLAMDGIEILLKTSNLSCMDINVFLKHWLTGGCPRLKYFMANVDDEDFDSMFTDLWDNVVIVEDFRQYRSPFGCVNHLHYGYDLQRADGVTATVCHQENGDMIIVFWPESVYEHV
ncbi:hypothetical protein CRE_04446 [Caenorhabditis remanei]|uniref:F-box domain-containing protein n=1 Tax=Caenorhabditis remanei TaxID=31234 RepID=E3NS14_CAERE|nr:hypothetical protein CRE_04446 [Caenorhabditis remanei]